jgi:hypothetical protein
VRVRKCRLREQLDKRGDDRITAQFAEAGVP